MSIEDAFISYDRVVHQSGSASLLGLGMAIAFIGIIFGWFYNSVEVVSVTAIIALISTIVAFLFIIKQYERSVILRLGKYNRQVSPSLHTRIPYIENVLVVDIRENVRVHSRKNAYKRQYASYNRYDTEVQGCRR
jgi:regulator of protease activity HflC (stomatin/prohibitin superfamily)